MKKTFSMGPGIKIMSMVLFAFVFLLPLSASAEIKGGSVELTPFVGYNFFSFDSQNLKNNWIYGGRIGYNFTPNFGIEGSGEFIRTRVDDRSIVGAKEGQYRAPTDRVDLIMYHADFVYHFMPEGRFNPFILAGFGGAHYDPKINHHGDMAVFNFGVGAKYWMTDHVALRFDLRDSLVTETFQETYHNAGATVGVVFAFGGGEKSTPAPAPVAMVEPQPEPKAVAPIVILASEPKVEEKVAVLAAEPNFEEKVIVLAFEDVHFEFDKSTLTAEAKVIIKRNLEILRKNPNARVRIAGYTSASGTEEYNQKLSERRSASVEAYLVKEGVAKPERLSTIGYGEKNPAEHEAAPKDLYSPAAKANMRVLFEIIVR